MSPSMPSPRPAAITLVTLAVLALFAMLHHPTIAAHGAEEALAEIRTEQPLNATVHGVMIAVVLLYHWCFSVLGAWLGRGRSAVSLAQLALHVGTGAFVGAALVSGFVVPELAARVEPTAQGVGTALVTLFAVNQALARLGTVAFGVAIAAWAVALLLQRPQGAAMLSRAVGAAGLLAGAAMVLGLLTGLWTLNVTGMTIVVVILGGWGCAAAAWLWQRPEEATESELP